MIKAMAQMQPTAVWILDCTNFLNYLEEILPPFVEKYPWLKSQSRHQRWDWKGSVLQMEYPHPLSQKDALINWIIREQLNNLYLFQIQDHHYSDEYYRIMNTMQCHCDLDRMVRLLLPIPRTTGYAELKLVQRVSGALIIEYFGWPNSTFD